MTELRKWIEHINDAYPMDIKNIWYEGGNEYLGQKIRKLDVIITYCLLLKIA